MAVAQKPLKQCCLCFSIYDRQNRQWISDDKFRESHADDQRIVRGEVVREVVQYVNEEPVTVPVYCETCRSNLGSETVQSEDVDLSSSSDEGEPPFQNDAEQ